MTTTRFEWTKEENKNMLKKLFWHYDKQFLRPHSHFICATRNLMKVLEKKSALFVCTYVCVGLCAVPISLFCFAFDSHSVLCFIFLIIREYYWVSMNGMASRKCLMAKWIFGMTDWTGFPKFTCFQPPILLDTHKLMRLFLNFIFKWYYMFSVNMIKQWKSTRIY